MVNIIRTLRSAISGVRPTGRQPGELYVNWADEQLGVVDAGGAPRDLIAVRHFSLTANYNAGDFVVQAAQLYRARIAIAAGAFNPTQWAVFISEMGGVFSGPVYLSGPNMLAMLGPTLTQRAILAGTGAVGSSTWRWQLLLADETPESGANAGANFVLNSFTDAGIFLRAPLVVNRASGVSTFSALPSFPGGAAGNVLTTNGAGALSWTPGGPPVAISDTPPANPVAGNLWWDSVGGQMYVRYDDGSSEQWVAASNPG